MLKKDIATNALFKLASNAASARKLEKLYQMKERCAYLFHHPRQSQLPGLQGPSSEKMVRCPLCPNGRGGPQTQLLKPEGLLIRGNEIAGGKFYSHNGPVSGATMEWDVTICRFNPRLQEAQDQKLEKQQLNVARYVTDCHSRPTFSGVIISRYSWLGSSVLPT